jgi:4-hydroxy-tetrahydrodipicolinate synthase
MITGSMVAIVTPMHEDGRLDLARFRQLIDWHAAEGTDGIVVVGTTGESPTVDFDEHKELIRIAVQHSRGRIPIIAGTGGNSTAEAIELTESAKKAGATACLSVVPYYNKPTQEGMYRHFSAVADAATKPVCLYNVPGRTAVNLSPATALRLAAHPNIMGIKEASGDLKQIMSLLRARADDFAVLSGDDWLTLPVITSGGDGLISVVSNEIPAAMTGFVHLLLSGNLEQARTWHYRLLPLMDANFLETNPAPVKAALHCMGRIANALRLPLVPVSEATTVALRTALRQAGVDV